MRNLAVLLASIVVSIVLAGCTIAPVAHGPDRLFNDQLFDAASARIDAGEVFALSDAMKRYLTVEIAARARARGSQLGLFDALYSKGQLKLDYDTTMTRNAAQAFDARSGNCLSLVIMTAAFAKEMGLPVQYRRVMIEDTWNRSGDMDFFIGHVNLTLGMHPYHARFRRDEGDLTIDFLPPPDTHGLRAQVIGEDTIVAMYMNNRAAEAIARRQLDDAYWWARAAIQRDPGFLSSYNTLGVIYKRHGNPAEAERVLAYALAREPQNTRVMSNLIAVLDDLGRVAESRVLARRLEQIEPDPPFGFYDRAMAALRAKDSKAARDLLAKEIDRAPHNPELHFWIAVAYADLGEIDQARAHLAKAIDVSTTRESHAFYAAKLDRINARLGQ